MRVALGMIVSAKKEHSHGGAREKFAAPVASAGKQRDRKIARRLKRGPQGTDQGIYVTGATPGDFHTVASACKGCAQRARG